MLNYASHQFYTTLNDLWADTEQIWEGVFSVIAAGIIYVCSVLTSQPSPILKHTSLLLDNGHCLPQNGQKPYQVAMEACRRF